jgi:hypothetical protein
MFNIPTVTVDSETLTGTSSSVTLDYAAPVGVSWTPRHLVVRAEMQATSGNPNVYFQLNGDSGSNYSYQMLTGYGTTKAANRNTSIAQLLLPGNIDDLSNAFTPSETLFPDALSTRTHKSALCYTGRLEEVVRVAAGRWASTAAITSVTISVDSSTFAATSTFELCVVDESYNIDQAGDGEQILGSDGKFTVSSIGGANGDLVCIGNLRVTATGQTEDHLHMQFNGDTTSSNYTRQYLRGKAAAVSAAAGSDALQGMAPASNAGTSIFGAFIAQVTNYSDGSYDRVATSLAGFHADTTFANVMASSGRWNNTAAITEIFLHGNAGSVEEFLTGSMLSTYAVPKNLIARQELTGTTATVTFSSIPDTYDHLELSVYARAAAQNITNVQTYFNGDTTAANYDRQQLRGRGSTVSAAQSAAQATYSAVVGDSNSTAEEFSPITFTIYNYKKTDRHKHLLVINGAFFTNLSDSIMDVMSGRWENTAAITSITLNPSNLDFEAGSVFELRGISATIPAAASDIAKVNTIALADIEAVN